MTPAPAVRRQFTGTRVVRMTPALHEHAVRLLSHAVTGPGPLNAVIGIATGGIAPADGIAATSGVPVYHVGARHNLTGAILTPATGNVSHDIGLLARALNGRRLAGRILLVDDICGSGATFAAITTAICPYLDDGATVRTAALCRNTGAARGPDWWIWTVSDWVLFPWDPEPRPCLVIEDLPEPGKVQTP
jgi:hypoxanthine phosphoribosyltransferase